MPVDTDSLERALNAIRKTYGDSAIHPGDDKPTLRRIPTGSLELDFATGGGIPIGRWCHWYGGYSSAKTLTAWNVIERAQKLGMDCAYYNAEKQYDKDWLVHRGGIDLKKLHVVEGVRIEEIGTKLETMLGVCHLHVIDSIAAAISVEELASKTEEWRPGIQARAWSKVLHRVNDRFDDNENVIIMINQVRDVFGRGGGEAPPGGRFIDYMARLSLHFRRSSWLYRNGKGFLDNDGSDTATLTGDTQPAGIEFQVRVAKSSVCPPFRTARMRLDFETGHFDEDWALCKAASYFKVVNQNGSWYTLPDGKTKVQGENGLREALNGDKKLADTVRSAMMAAA